MNQTFPNEDDPYTLHCRWDNPEASLCNHLKRTSLRGSVPLKSEQPARHSVNEHGEITNSIDAIQHSPRRIPIDSIIDHATKLD